MGGNSGYTFPTTYAVLKLELHGHAMTFCTECMTAGYKHTCTDAPCPCPPQRPRFDQTGMPVVAETHVLSMQQEPTYTAELILATLTESQLPAATTHHETMQQQQQQQQGLGQVQGPPWGNQFNAQRAPQLMQQQQQQQYAASVAAAGAREVAAVVGADGRASAPQTTAVQAPAAQHLAATLQQPAAQLGQGQGQGYEHADHAPDLDEGMGVAVGVGVEVGPAAGQGYPAAAGASVQGAGWGSLSRGGSGPQGGSGAGLAVGREGRASGGSGGGVWEAEDTDPEQLPRTA